MNDFPPFKIEYALKMLPLLIRYCRDIRIKYNEIQKDIRAIDKIEKKTNRAKKTERIKQLEKLCGQSDYEVRLLAKRLREWAQEIEKLGCKMGDYCLGLIDVEVLDKRPGDNFGKAIVLCISSDTKINSLMWHSSNCQCDGRKPFYWR